MKKWIVPALCLSCLFTLFLFGCKTPPKDKTPMPAEPVEDTAPVQDTGSDLNAANKKLIDQIAAARKKAIDAGAKRYFSNELTVVDIAAREAQTVYEAGGDPAEFNKKASDILYQYKALEQAALAAAARKKIADMNFADYASADYNAAEKASRKAEQMFAEGAAGKDLYEQAKAAADKYNAVLNAGYKALAEKEREKVLALKEKADAVKAGVADKTGYTNAVAFFTRGNQDLQTGKNESAYNNFVKSYGMLDTVYQDVLKKRAAAEEAMARAKRRVEEADAVAVKADDIAPIEKVEALVSPEEAQ